MRYAHSPLGIAATLFAANGIAVGTTGASLAGLRARLGVAEDALALVLIVAGLAGIGAMQLAGRAADARGATWPSAVGAAVMAVGLAVVAAAPTYALVLVGAGIAGVGSGAMDVGMNALGVAAEQVRGKAVMSRLHATFSAGGMGGSLLVLGAGVVGITGAWAPLAFAATALGGVALVGLMRWRGVTVGSAAAGGTVLPARWRQRALVIGALAMASGLAEGTAFDWSSIHVTDVAGVAASVGALGLACCSGAMMVTRLAGDALVSRFGQVRVAPVGAVVAAGGFAMTFAGDSLLWLGLSWAVVGAGVGVVNPQIYAAAGRLGGGRALALVTSMGYTAFLVGPGVIGFAAARVGISGAMVIPLVAAVVAAVLARPVFVREGASAKPHP